MEDENNISEAGKHIGSGLGWLGFWIMLGLIAIAVTQGSGIEVNVDQIKKQLEPIANQQEE